MSETMNRTAFLEAIKAEPDDDTHRLVFADWLEENGEPERAEFIRVQVKRARPTDWDPGPASLEARERELLKQNGEAWLGPLHPLLIGWHSLPLRGLSPRPLGRWQFRRGLLRVAAFGWPEELEALAESEAWAWVEALLLPEVTPEDVWRLGGLRLLRRLSSLSLSQYDFRGNAEAVADAVASLDLPQLTSLGLDFTGLRPVIGAVASLSFPRLTSLRLASPGIGVTDPPRLGEEGARALADMPYLAQLTTLQVERNSIGDGGAQALAASPLLARLTTLDLSSNEIGPRGAQALASSPHLGQLTALGLGSNLGTLGRNTIGGDGARALVSSPHLARLTALDLRGNRLGPQGAQALASSPHLGRLTALNLRNNDLGDEGAKALASSPHLAGVAFIDLRSNGIHPRQKAALLQRFGGEVRVWI
jgi:uncharacterized protein (TIGR02996 family)